jgi:hypothetical protein
LYDQNAKSNFSLGTLDISLFWTRQEWRKDKFCLIRDAFETVPIRVSDPDPDSVRSVDPDPYSGNPDPDPGGQKGHKSRKKLRNFMF